MINGGFVFAGMMAMLSMLLSWIITEEEQWQRTKCAPFTLS